MLIYKKADLLLDFAQHLYENHFYLKKKVLACNFIDTKQLFFPAKV